MASQFSAETGPELRLDRQGVERSGALTEIFCDGRALTAIAGESTASTLTARVVRKFCRSREGDERGVFCGMGVCFDCRVTVNGRPGERACLTTVQPEMRVETETRFSPHPSDAGWAPVDREERCSVLIIGGGPAGLAAAEVVAQHQIDVVVLDECPYPGGQYYKPLVSSHRFKNDQPFDRQYRDGLALAGRVRELGVRICCQTLVWDAQAEGGGRIVVRALDDQGSINWIAQKLIIATGAFEQAWPVPGWTLPVVMTTGPRRRWRALTGRAGLGYVASNRLPPPVKRKSVQLIPFAACLK